MFRRDRSLLCQLPEEIIQDRIFALLFPADQASLRRTSKLLFNLSIRPFFRNVVLTGIPQTVRCCELLLAKPAYADAVRVFVIGLRRNLDGPMLASFWRLFRCTVRLLRRVVHLDLNIFIGVMCPWILDETCEFSCLRQIRLSDMSILSPSFLRRHPTLEHISFKHMLCPCEMPTSETQIYLPNLKTYLGPFKLLPLIAPGSSICHVGLVCGHDLPESRWIDLMLGLRQSRSPIWVFECHMRAFQRDMMLAIGSYLPDLRVLRLLDKHVWNEQDATNMLAGLSTLTAVLSSLRHLQSIDLIFLEGPPNWRPNVEQVRRIVLGFGADCPSLKHVAMDGLVWVRVDDNTWAQITSDELAVEIYLNGLVPIPPVA